MASKDWEFLRNDSQIQKLQVGQSMVLSFNWPGEPQDLIEDIQSALNKGSTRQYNVTGIPHVSEAYPGLYLGARVQRSV